MSKIILNWKEISFEKKYSTKTKNIRLSIDSNWNLVLTIPKLWFFTDKNFIENKAMDFLKNKSSWILKHIWNHNNSSKNPNLTNSSREHYLKYKNQAKELCEKKCLFWALKMWLKYNKISVKLMKTKWGSCSSKKNLNFNYKILFLDEIEQNYLVVHELSHLKYMNHSKNFWDLVCETLGSQKFRRYKIN